MNARAGWLSTNDVGRSGSFGALADVHVLVVDDNRDARDITKFSLEADHARVTTCETAWEALHLLGQTKPGVLVADIVMPPGDNALWLIRAIRKRSPQAGGRIPALAVTAYGPMFTRQRALAAGFDAFLERPIERWELCRVVAMLAGQQRPRLVHRTAS